MPNHIKFDQNRYRREWLIAHESAERTQYRRFKKALDAQTGAVSDYIKRHGISELEKYLSVLIEPKIMADAYLKCYQEVGIARAGWVYKNITAIATGNYAKNDPISFFSERWRKLMSYFFHTKAGDRIKDVNDTTKQTIQKTLDEMQTLPISMQATEMVNRLDDPDYNRMRALRIARTETTAAANYGAFLGGDSSDYEVAKMWVSVLDNNTRPAHAAANGETVAIDTFFWVMGEEMQYPGDLNGSAANCVQCRCCLAIVPLENEMGLPILKKAS